MKKISTISAIRLLVKSGLFRTPGLALRWLKESTNEVRKLEDSKTGKTIWTNQIV